MKNLISVFAALSFFVTTVYCQSKINLKTQFVPSSDSILAEGIQLKNTFSDSIEFNAYLKQLKLHFLANGFLTYAYFIDSKPDTLLLTISTGKAYYWGYLKKGNVLEQALAKSGFNAKFYHNKPFKINQLTQLFKSVISFYENHGYPFAEIKLDSISIAQNQISATLNVIPNQLYMLDSFLIMSDDELPKTYIQNYLGIKTPNPYNEGLYSQIPNRINEIPFAKQTKPHKINFYENFATMEVFLAKQRASNFNGIIGFLPDNTTGDILFTGDIKLNLQNALKEGETINMNWRKLQDRTQDLQIKFVYPFLFKTPIGFETDLKLYRRDTLFSEQNIKLGIQYALSRGNFVRIFFGNQFSSLISTNGLEFLTVLPPYADTRRRSYGIGFVANKLNYKFNPRSGFSFDVSGSVGTKEILVNPLFNPIVYENQELKTVQFDLQSKIEFYIPIFKRSTIKLANQAGWLLNNNLLQNEMYRIGGIQTLRGFDEESILASGYSIFTTEYRLLFEQNAYVYAFSDICFFERNQINFYDTDLPFSFGTGISFETKAGIFTLNYALGQQRNNTLNLANAKIHFGFVSLF